MTDAMEKYEENTDSGTRPVTGENRMGTEPVHGLLIKMSLPLMASMMVMALYNVVDTYFVARMGTEAVAAVSLCFPVQQLMIAFGVGTAIGMSALLSRFLGAKQHDRLITISQNGLFLAFVNFIIFFIVGRFATQFLSIQTNDPVIREYGVQYLSIVCTISLPVFLEITVERFLQASGKTGYIFFVQGVGAIINIILDPILIFGLLGAPALGVRGAAIATVIGQTIGTVIGFIINQTKNPEIVVTLRNFRIDPREIREIYRIGVPSIIMQAIGSVMVFSYNMILKSFGDPTATIAVAVFGIYFKLQSFVFMPVFGMNNGLVPIIAYNYGARKKKRMQEAMHISARYGVGIMTAGMLIFWIFPEALLSLFDDTGNMTALGIVTLRTISVSFPFAGYAIMRGSVFQAVGKSIYSMNISVVRQLVVLIPAAFLLSRLGDVNLVWLAFPIAEIVGITMSVIYSRKVQREIINKL